MRSRLIAVAGLAACACLQPGCATRSTRGLSPLGVSCSVAEAHLKEDWRKLMDATQTPDGCLVDNGLLCDAIRARIRRLAVDCPSNSEVILANAVLAFEERNLVGAQQLLDQLDAMRPLEPEAAVLRARIALQDGNDQFAIRYLTKQIELHGDNADLRETFASALYFAKRWDEAVQQLDIARELGAPAWRISYGRGLIEEARANYAQARRFYEASLQGRPGWPVALSRLRALIASGKATN